MDEQLDMDLESIWSRQSMDGLSADLDPLIQRNADLQRELTKEIDQERDRIFSRLNSILAIHLNQGQEYSLNQSNVFISLRGLISSSSSKVFIRVKFLFIPLVELN